MPRVRIVGARVVLPHIRGDFEQLHAAATTALEVCKTFPRAQEHLAGSVELIVFSILADFARVAHSASGVILVLHG